MKQTLLLILASLLLQACLLESSHPLISEENIQLTLDPTDDWVMMHNHEAQFRIHKSSSNLYTVSMFSSQETKKQKIEFTGDIIILGGSYFYNARTADSSNYQLYRFSQPCKDVILIYMIDTNALAQDIQSGSIKGHINQDLMKMYTIDAGQSDLQSYIKNNQDKLFIPFRYIVRKSKIEKLDKTCKLKKYPGVPISPKKQ